MEVHIWQANIVMRAVSDKLMGEYPRDIREDEVCDRVLKDRSMLLLDNVLYVLEVPFTDLLYVRIHPRLPAAIAEPAHKLSEYFWARRMFRPRLPLCSDVI